MRDAAYESLLKEKRRAIHARILTALEADRDIAPEVLAAHAEAANLTDRAIGLWDAASKSAIARPAFREGISNLRRAISLLSPRIADGDVALTEQALKLQVQLGVACMQGIGYGTDETKEALEHALVLADKVGETPLRPVVLYAHWTGMFVRAEHAEAHTRAKEVLRLAENTGNTEMIGVGSRLVGISRFAKGRFAETEHYFNKSLALLDPIENKDSASRIGQDAATATLVYVSWTAAVRARTRDAINHAMEAEKAALTSEHLPSICYMHAHLMFVSLTCGDETALERHTIALKPIAEEHNLEIWEGVANACDAILSASKGDALAIDSYFQADAKLTAINFRLYMPLFRIFAGRRALALGLKDQAQSLAAMAEELMQATGETLSLSDLHMLQAALAKADGDHDASESLLNTALDVARQQDARLFELRASIDLAQLLKDQGRSDEALALLEPIHASIAEGDCPEDQTMARKLLSELAS